MLSVAVKDFLVANSIGTYGTDIFIRVMPDTPDDAICIFDEPGTINTENLRYDLDNFGYEIMFRGSYAWVMDKLFKVHRITPQWTGDYTITVEGNDYDVSILETFTQTTPAFIENDDKGRVVYTAHYESECSIGATSRTST